MIVFLQKIYNFTCSVRNKFYTFILSLYLLYCFISSYVMQFINLYFYICHNFFSLNNHLLFISIVFYFIIIIIFFFLLYNIVLVLPYINMHPPWVYMCGWGTCEILVFSSWFCLMLTQWLQLSLGSCLYSMPFSSFHFQPVYFLD